MSLVIKRQADQSIELFDFNGRPIGMIKVMRTGRTVTLACDCPSDILVLRSEIATKIMAEGSEVNHGE